MSRIGLLFGSFNPIHTGHIKIAYHALILYVVDKVWLVPAKQNLFKPPYEISDNDRLNMLHCIINPPALDICTVEFEENLPSTLTYNVIAYIKNHYCTKDDTLVIICGSDMYNEIKTWEYGSEIYKEQFYIYDRALDDVSSSMIRKKIKNGEDFREFVPVNVYNYIIKNKLYVDTTEA